MKILKLLNIASLSLATSSIPVLAVSNKQVNLADAKVYMGNCTNSYFTVRFTTDSDHTDWGTFAEIYKCTADASETIDTCIIPATVTAEDGNQYKVRRIDTCERCSGKGVIQEMDFSQAKYLYEISEVAFGRDNSSSKSNCPFTIKSVYFAGAESLSYIWDDAFRAQPFSNQYGHKDPFNFLNTSLKEVRYSAFRDSAESTNVDVEWAVFPKTIANIWSYGFGYGGSKRIRVKKIIFTDPEGALNMQPMDDESIGLPRLINFDSYENQVIAPYGAYDPYYNHVLSDSQWSGTAMEKYRKKLCTSSIVYDESHRGSYQVCGLVGQDGVDKAKATWTPWKGTEFATDATTYLLDDYDGKFGFDSLGHLTWSKDLPLGEYKLTIISYRYDDSAKSRLSPAISDTITVTIVDAAITGGSTILKGETTKTGQDSKYWTPVIKSTPTHNILKCTYTLKSVPSAISGKVHVKQNPNNELQYCITWDAGLPEGKYSFLLQPTIVVEGMETPVTLASKQIVLQIDETPAEYGMTLSYQKNGTGNWIDYQGETIELTKTDTVKFKVVTGLALEYGASPKLSIDIVDPQMSGGTDQTYYFTIDAAKQSTYDNYKFNFCVYADEVVPSTQETVAAYSDIINIQIGDDTSSLLDVATDVYVDKHAQGASCTIPVINTDTFRISSNPTLTVASWMPTSKTGAIDYVSCQKDDEGKNLILNFSPEFFTFIGPFDYLDCCVNFLVTDTSSNSTINYRGSFSLISEYTGSFKYDGESKLYGYPTRKVVFEEPFEYLLNSESVSKLNNVTYSCQVECENPELYSDTIYLEVSSDTNTVKLVCDNQEVTQATQEGLKVNIYAVDSENLTTASTSVMLYVDNMLFLDNVPDQISSKAYISGKYEKPILTKLNGETVVSQYTLLSETIADHISIDESGYISWDDQLKPGEYEVTIQSTVEIKGQQYTLEETTQFKILEPDVAPKDYTLVIATTSSAAGGAALTGGISGIVIKSKKRGKK